MPYSPALWNADKPPELLDCCTRWFQWRHCSLHVISNHRTLPLAQCIIIKCRKLEAKWSAIFIISPLLHMANVCWNPTCAPLFAEMTLTVEPHSIKYSPDAWTTHSNICSDNMDCDRWQYCSQIPQNPLDTFHAVLLGLLCVAGHRLHWGLLLPVGEIPCEDSCLSKSSLKTMTSLHQMMEQPWAHISCWPPSLCNVYEPCLLQVPTEYSTHKRNPAGLLCLTTIWPQVCCMSVCLWWFDLKSIKALWFVFYCAVIEHIPRQLCS